MIELVKFMGANMKEDDQGNREYTPRGPIWVNPANVVGVYDHTILTNCNRIRVMETSEQILAKLR